MPRIAKISKAELIRLQKKLHTDEAIGKKFGITRQAVHWNRKKYGIHPIPGARTIYKPPRISKANLIKLQQKLRTNKAIANELNISSSTVSVIRIKYGIPAIIRDNTVRNNSIVALYKKGLSGPAISNKFHLSISQTYNIIYDAGAGRRKTAKKVLKKKTPSKKR